MTDQGWNSEQSDAEEWGDSGPSNAIKIAAAVIGIALLAFIGLLATSNEVQNGSSDEPVGESAPLVDGVSYTGETYSLETVLVNNRGLAPAEQTWTVVNFYASWCVACIQEHPDLTAFDSRTGPCVTELVGVAINDRARDVKEFFELRGGNWPVLVGADTTQIIVGYSVTAPPETVIIAPDGTVVLKWIGAITIEDLENFFASVDCT